MTLLVIILTVLTAGVLCIWLGRHVMISRQSKRTFLLTEDYIEKNAGNTDSKSILEKSPPRISVIIAAKDEQDCIERCVRTMLMQDYPNFEIIVANDRSTDRTAQIVERIANEDNRLRLINIKSLPEGWCGKNNAMQTAILQSSGEWICMTDADCWQQSSRTLSVAMAYALDTNADLLSILPNLEMKSFWENVVQPVAGGIMMIWFLPDKVNNPQKKNAYANGAFMLMKRSAYDAIGGHQAVRDKVNEDMHIAAKIKSMGLNLRIVQNKGLYFVRMYSSLKQSLQGWSRIFFGTFCTFRRLLASLLLLTTMSLLPYIVAIIGLVGWAIAAESKTLFLIMGLTGLAAVIAQMTVLLRYYPLVNAKRSMIWTYPLGCLICFIALVSAMFKLRPGAKITWRNTTYAQNKA